MLKKSIIFMAVFLIFGTLFTSCGNAKDNSSSEYEPKTAALSSENTAETVSVKNILSQISDDNLDAGAYIGDEIFKANCENLFGATQDNFADAGIIYASGGGIADEISVLRSNGSSDCEELLKKRPESRCNTFENYNPEEMDKLNSSQIFKSGDFWVLIISDNSEKLKEEIEQLTK